LANGKPLGLSLKGPVIARSSYRLWLVPVFVLVTAALACLYYGILLDLIFPVVLAGGLCLYAILRFPEVFMVAVAFAPQWKEYGPLRWVDQMFDVTLLMLICLSAVMLGRILARLGLV
jgi:hypothetical protein